MTVTKPRMRLRKLLIAFGVASLVLAGIGVWQISTQNEVGVVAVTASHASSDGTLGDGPDKPKPVEKPAEPKPLGDTNPI